MHFLLTNDDGIDAPGLAALSQAVGLIRGATFTIVAPATEQSECGHRLTTRVPLILQQLDEHRYSLNGSPADCTRVALHHLKLKPDWVFAGINSGGNMGQDLAVSGTVAAVREAAYHDVPAAAFSHYLIREIELDWSRAARWVAELITTRLLPTSPPIGQFYNFNLPHHPPGALSLPGVVESAPARSPLPVVYAPLTLADGTTQLMYGGRYPDRGRDPGSDVEACFSGHVSMSTLHLPS
ncbi:5'/3'-nucleotidase SurE [Phragmitibacter flavus]|uniref:5'-nucleotidase n=1 Tax=Phragmitibacter flavus TaxID=2576071 RepID=A0A5R8KDS4_9BACT|nr:5'/3'-nucleotidase SurE [Phragmitibacter flavus]TLD70452.1 5'/3'-nucleotidase SurE [Phragmitibacter flavus]